MKKILLVLLFAAVAQITLAQDFKKLKISVGILKWEDAKTEVDKLANDPKAKDKPELYYYQARIYAALFTTYAPRRYSASRNRQLVYIKKPAKWQV